MRSDLIYDALDTVRNRYLLCQLISKATRKFHKPNTRVQETMNDVLVRVGKAAEPTSVIELPHPQVAEPPASRCIIDFPEKSRQAGPSGGPSGFLRAKFSPLIHKQSFLKQKNSRR